jgi:phenylacetate-CoA ligase
VIAAAEPFNEPTRRRIEEGIGAPVFNTYGSREFMSIAGECDRHDGLHINAENILLQTALSPEEGPSEILVTDLHNYGMPFLRYSIGDAGVLEYAPCACGRGLPRLRSIDGRILDLLQTADGRTVPGEFFPHLLKDVPEIVEYQIEQTDLRRIHLSVVLSGDFSRQSQELLAQECRKVLGDGTELEITRVDRIPRLPSGKRRPVIGLGSVPRERDAGSLVGNGTGR